MLGTLASPGTCISLRVPAQRNFSLEDCVASGSLTPGTAQLLSRLIGAKLAFLISGGTKHSRNNASDEAAKAERRRVLNNNRHGTAEIVRREWLKNFVAHDAALDQLPDTVIRRRRHCSRIPCLDPPTSSSLAGKGALTPLISRTLGAAQD